MSLVAFASLPAGCGAAVIFVAAVPCSAAVVVEPCTAAAVAAAGPTQGLAQPVSWAEAPPAR